MPLVLKEPIPQQPKRRESGNPLWKGPEEDGITFSLLSRFLVCRERFRIHAIEGLHPIPSFNHKIEYGNMWHICEEKHGKGEDWESALTDYCKKLASTYRLQQEEVDKWYNVCLKQFPIYLEHWANHPETEHFEPLCTEEVFDVQYSLPSGARIRLRGKWDGLLKKVAHVKGNTDPVLFLQENKAKGDPRTMQIQKQLGYDLQTMLYLVALEEKQKDDFWRRANKRWRDLPIAGVRYNVIRRPLSGGKGTIVQHKPSKSNPHGETKESFYNRLQQYMIDEPEHYFMRWNSYITTSEIKNFRRDCLDPILEQLWYWYHWMSGNYQKGIKAKDLGKEMTMPLWMIHWRHPYGVYNILDEGGSTDLDEYLATGSEAGLTRDVKTLFPELEG